MALPNVNITPIPDTDPDAVPSLWNTRYAEMDENFAHLEAGLLDQAGNAHSADEAIKLAWWMQDTKVKIEQWTSEWSLHDPLSIAVTEGVAGDDSVDVANTAGLVVGREYVIYDATHSETVVVSEVLTSTRFTTAANLAHSYTTGAKVEGCQWDVAPNLAHTVNGEICYFLPLTVGEDSGDKTVIVRRENNDCGLKVYFKDADQVTWLECTAGSSTETEPGVVDVPYAVPGKGLITLKFVCETGGADDNMDIYLVGALNLSISHNVIYENTTFYLSAIGNDTTGNGSSASPWLTVNKVFDALANKRINEGVTVTIELDDGTYSYAAPILANHVDGAKIAIKGKNVYQKTMSEIINTTGTEATPQTDANVGNTIQAVIELNNVTNVEVGDYALVKNLFANVDASAVYDPATAYLRSEHTYADLSSRGVPLHLNGVFKVAAVNAGASQITITTKFRAGTTLSNLNVITGEREGDVTIIKSILEFTASSGIRVENGHQLGGAIDMGGTPGIDNLVVHNMSPYNDASQLDFMNKSAGVLALDGAGVSIGPNVGLDQWYAGLNTVNGGNAYARGIVTTGCNWGLLAGGSASIEADYSYHSGSKFGAGLWFNGAINARGSVFVCCCYGVIPVGGVLLVGWSAFENCYDAVHANENGLCHAMYERIYNSYHAALAVTEGGHIMGNGSYLSGGAYGVHAKNGKVNVVGDTTITGFTSVGVYAERFANVIINSPTLSDNTADFSPALAVEGNTHAYIIDLGA